MNRFPTLSKEWRWAIGWSAALLLLSCVPYLIAWQAAPPGWHFAGILVNPLDGHSYLAKMEQGRQDLWLFQLTYTPEPHEGAFIFTFYLALGHLARLTGLSKIIVFHLARLLAGLALLLVAFRFTGRVTAQPAERRLAFVFILSAGGLGWLGAIAGRFPIDLWIPEAFVPYSIFANPHFPLAMALMLLIFERFLLPSATEPTLSSLLYAGLLALGLAMVLPFALLTGWAVLVIFLGWLYASRRRLPWPQIWLTLSVIVFSMPVLLYQYWVSTSNPILAGWGAQNVTPAPRWADFGLGYGLIGLLALLGAGRVIQKTMSTRTARPPEWLVLIWAVVTVGLVYVPFELQRRLITGLHLPLCMLAAIGLHRWVARVGLPAGYQRLLKMGTVAIGAIGTLAVWGIPLLGTLQAPEQSATTALFFIRDEEQAAFAWLQAHSEPGDVILASARVGMFVPGQTGARAYYGHPFETVQAKKKRTQAETFFRGERARVTPPADFIIYGPSERALGQPVGLATRPAVFSAGTLKIYKNVE